MAYYNNGFPATYQPLYQPIMPTPIQYQQPQPVVTPQSPPAANSISWVQGEAGAKAYPVAAGNTVMLLDSEDSVFYLKSTDASGMPQPLRIFEFKEKTHNQPVSSPIQTPNLDNYVTWDKLEERLSQFVVDKPKKTAKEGN